MLKILIFFKFLNLKFNYYIEEALAQFIEAVLYLEC